MLGAGRRTFRPPRRGELAAAILSTLLVAWPGPTPGQPIEAQRAAVAVARLGELEEELRRLRGRIEALEAERDRLRGRLEQVQRDLEARLAALEAGRPPDDATVEPRPGMPTVSRGGPPAVAAVPASPQVPAPPRAPAPPPAPAAALRPLPPTAAPVTPPRPPGRTPAEVEGDLAARRGYVLGTIPRAAILGTEPVQAAPAPGGGAPATVAPSERPAPPPTATAPGQQAARTPSGGPAPGGPTAAGRLAAARELLQKGDWPAAEDALRRYLEDFPNDPQAATAAYWLGETYLVREDWQNAAATFARNYRTFGAEAPRAPDNLLKLGVALARLGDREKACQTFAELERRHPGASSAVRQALARERIAAGCG